MSQSCIPADLIKAARCFPKYIPSGMIGAVKIYLLCQWAKRLGK